MADLDELLKQLGEAGVRIDPKREDYSYDPKREDYSYDPKREDYSYDVLPGSGTSKKTVWSYGNLRLRCEESWAPRKPG